MRVHVLLRNVARIDYYQKVYPEEYINQRYHREHRKEYRSESVSFELISV